MRSARPLGKDLTSPRRVRFIACLKQDTVASAFELARELNFVFTFTIVQGVGDNETTSADFYFKKLMNASAPD